MKLFKSNAFQWIVVILIISVIAGAIYYWWNKLNDKISDVERAVITAEEEAKKDLGEDCEFVTVKIQPSSKYYDIYLVGYVNSDNSRAIMYVVKHFKGKDIWFATEETSSLEGGNARELFNGKFTYVE